jgi:hypothetical protein
MYTREKANTLLMDSFIGQVLSVNNDYIEFVKNFGAFKRTYPVSKIFSADLIYRPGNKSIVLNSQRIYFNQTYVLLSGMKRLVYPIKTRILGVDDLYIILEDGMHLAICEIKSIKKVK